MSIYTSYNTNQVWDYNKILDQKLNKMIYDQFVATKQVYYSCLYKYSISQSAVVA